MRVLGVAAAMAVLFGAANAATISVTNGNFEDGGVLKYGAWERGADGWTRSGDAGTFAPGSYGLPSYDSPPAALGSNVGYLNASSSMRQLLDATIEAGVSYTLTALFGARLQHPGAGTFGFYADNVTNVIGVQAVAPGAGNWTLESFTLDATAMASFVGQRLGIIFYGSVTQLNFDTVSVLASISSDNPGDDVETLVNPVPGALPLMLTGLLGGWFANRRRKKAA